jgi:hypothetical protein
MSRRYPEPPKLHNTGMVAEFLIKKIQLFLIMMEQDTLILKVVMLGIKKPL